MDGERAGLAFFAIASDVSYGGMCLKIDGPIPNGCTIRIDTHLEYGQISGHVKYVIEREGIWHIGIQFLDFKWNFDTCWPENQSYSTDGSSQGDPSEAPEISPSQFLEGWLAGYQKR